ncbi:MAG: DUF938 domain-containing protein, partial [Alphaproteobacteria bacterium]|nr:DUF938 domain-containing protein [Alphaproteobacteria bacterium]
GDVAAAAAAHGLELSETVDMPANNLSVVLRGASYPGWPIMTRRAGLPRFSALSVRCGVAGASQGVRDAVRKPW